MNTRKGYRVVYSADSAMRNATTIIAAIILAMVLPWILICARQKIYRDNSILNTQTTAQSIASEDVYSTAEILGDTTEILITGSTGKQFTEKMDAYLVGVLLSEMPMSFDIEALKSQAVASRTYALRQQMSASKHNSSDVCTNPGCCQGYCSIDSYLNNGGSLLDVEKAKQAVAETNNLVLVYNDSLIDATFFSCSGGMTESAIAVWGSEIPYLQATNSPGEEFAEHYIDTITMTVSDFYEHLQLENHAYPVISNIIYTAGGGVDSLEIDGITYKGTQVRSMLSLRSTAFVISIVDGTVTITTKGYGHRVGLSQYGAEVMAKQGKTFVQILSHYYRDTHLISIEKLID